MDIQWAIGIFFIVALAVFFIIAILLPEWVGITGAKAKDIIRHQQGDDANAPKEPDLEK